MTALNKSKIATLRMNPYCVKKTRENSPIVAGRTAVVIEAIDELVIGKLIEGLAQYGDWRLLVMPDHPTPCALKTHSSEAVPFAVMSSTDHEKPKGQSRRYTEADARDQEIGIVGYEIPFNRYFYEYMPPRGLNDIDADLDLVSRDIMKLLQEVHS